MFCLQPCVEIAPIPFGDADVYSTSRGNAILGRLQEFCLHCRGHPWLCRIAADGYTSIRAVVAAGSCSAAIAKLKTPPAPWQPTLLGRLCPLLARKFENGTEAVVVQVLEAAGAFRSGDRASHMAKASSEDLTSGQV